MSHMGEPRTFSGLFLFGGPVLRVDARQEPRERVVMLFIGGEAIVCSSLA